MSHKQKLIILTALGGVGGLVFLVLYILSIPANKGVPYGNHNYLSFIFICTLGPVSFYATWYEIHLDSMEYKFSEFLLDLAEYWKVGLSMTTAVQTIADGEYGALNKQIRKMATQISWGVAFNDVLLNFTEDIPTRLVARSVSLILESNKAGGKIADVLVTAAKDASEIKWLQKERQKGVFMYVVVIYVSFMVYLAVIGIITAVFLPAIIEASTAMAAEGSSGFGSMQVRQLEREYLVFVFYCSVLVQAVGNGLMAGVMGKGKLTQGLIHVWVMTLMGELTFGLVIGFGTWNLMQYM
jgi:flagellar protein FlaJ